MSGWAAESLGRFDIVGLDPGVLVYQLVGDGLRVGVPRAPRRSAAAVGPGRDRRSVPGYELRALIGMGELGEVHRAYQPSVGREVAVRIFGPWMVGHPQFVRRFESASQRITRVEHPHVVPLLDYWREPSRAVMVSRLVRGGHLGQRIPATGLDPAAALAMFETVASGIASAHRHGVVHGRIRPENVLFDDEDNAYVADLGVDEICTGIITFATDAYDAPERLGGSARHTGVGHVLPRRPGPPSAQRLAATAGRRRCRSAGMPSTRSSPGRPILTRAAAMVRSTSSSTSSARRSPSRRPTGGVRADPQPVPRAGAVRAGRRPATSTVATRPSREMVDVLERERLLVVVGPSGIGKSSVVKAGLVPALRRGAVAGSESWLVTEMVPGQRSVRAAGRGAGPRRHGHAARRRRRAELATLSRSTRSFVGVVPRGTELSSS